MRERYCTHCGAALPEGCSALPQANPLPKLSQRERDVITLMLSGYTEGQMAKALYLTVGTVKTYKRTIFKKLGVHSRRELFSRIYASGQTDAIQPVFCPRCGQVLPPQARYCGACGTKL